MKKAILLSLLFAVLPGMFARKQSKRKELNLIERPKKLCQLTYAWCIEWLIE